MIMSTTGIYDKNGRRVGEMGSCDEYKPKPPRWMWRDVVIGLFAALVMATQIFA